MKLIFKILLYSLLAIILFLIAYIFVSLICSNISTRSTKSSSAKHSIHIQTNGVHTDVIITKELLRHTLIDQLDLKSNTNYYAFGWGDKGFYLDTPEWKDLKASTAIKAMFLPSETAMHVTGYSSTHGHWSEYSIDDAQLNNLLNYIYESFKYKNDKVILIPHHCYGDNDRFFEAKGSYSCIKTCNTWTNRALKTADIPTAIWTPFDWGVYQFINKK